jgi:menaquinone-dependent protoporphyrinogen oxidase
MLIVYGTDHGHAARVVRRIAAILTTRDWEVTLERGDRLPAHLTIERFNAVLVAASIHGGRHQHYIEEYVRRHREELSRKPSAFVSVSGAAGDPRAHRQAAAWQYVVGFMKATGWAPTLKTIVGGCIAYTRYGFFLKWMTWAVAKRSGGPTDTTRDHEFTNWSQVDHFAEDMDRQLRPAERPAALLT